MKPLTDAEHGRVAQHVSQVKALMPELVSEVKALVDAGLIEGWRNVTYAGPHRQGMCGAGVVRGDQMVLESTEAFKARMKT